MTPEHINHVGMIESILDAIVAFRRFYQLNKFGSAHGNHPFDNGLNANGVRFGGL